MESCPTQAVLPLVGLARDNVIRDRCKTTWDAPGQGDHGSKRPAIAGPAREVNNARENRFGFERIHSRHSRFSETRNSLSRHHPSVGIPPGVRRVRASIGGALSGS
ncbi:MAG: hypothetical protein R6U98_15645 [Pirellulaceae bacterium]